MHMKKIAAEFKKFIMRGNIVDMAVGVIVGSSFTAIVNALSNNILKPLINYLLALVFGADSLSEVYTFLKKEVVDGVVVLEESIYIDWGAFINAVINFFLIALVLFSIVKIVNVIRDGKKKLVEELLDDVPTKEDRKEMKKLKIKMTDANVKAFLAEKKLRLEEEAAKAKAEAEEKARLDRLANPTTEDLLKEILAEMKKQ
jgi:large conductance mechanosensitive channel